MRLKLTKLSWLLEVSLTVVIFATIFLDLMDMTEGQEQGQGSSGGDQVRQAGGGIPGDGRRRRRDHQGKRVQLIRRLMRSRVKEGTVRLVDGRTEHEGRVEIFHENKWGPICDDDWDTNEATVVCRQLGYSAESVNSDSLIFEVRSTHSGRFGHARGPYWLDNVFCDGREKLLTDCRHEGWGINDCGVEETAGVICARPPNSEEILEERYSNLNNARPYQQQQQPPQTRQLLNLPRKKFQPENVTGRKPRNKIEVELAGGRVPNEGRVLIRLTENSPWGLICGDGWSLLEAGVICRQLKMGYAEGAPQTDYFGGLSTEVVTTGVKCQGGEEELSQCYHHDHPDNGNSTIFCPGNGRNFASVVCTHRLPDLVPDANEVARSAYLEDKLLYSLQCAMEENCLASSAYRNQEANPYSWHTEVRRLLRFTARIVNAGNADFRPAIPKYMWQFHACHMHFHSMEVFAVFDILDYRGRKVAEGHKASFCLEDNECIVKKEQPFACANFGDQGISVGCADIYRANIDCQWIDVTDIVPGTYTFKMSINGEMKVPESDFSNNAVICNLQYTESAVYLNNCTLTQP